MASDEERSERFNRRSFMPRDIGTKYNLGDMLDMLWVDAHIREFIEEFDELDMEKKLSGMEEGQVITIHSVQGHPLMQFRKDGDFYTLITNFGLAVPRNDRAICSDADFGSQSGGYGFAAGGGNSYPKGLRFS